MRETERPQGYRQGKNRLRGTSGVIKAEQKKDTERPLYREKSGINLPRWNQEECT